MQQCPLSLEELRNASFCYNKIENYQKALELQLQIATHLQHTSEDIKQVAFAYTRTGDWKNAAAKYEEYISKKQKIEAQDYVRLGHYYREVGNEEKAIEFYQKAAPLYTQVLSTANKVNSNLLREAAHSYYYSGNIEEAVSIREKIIEELKDEVEPRDFSRAAFTIMRLDYISEKRIEKMLEWSKKAIELFDKMPFETFQKDTLNFFWRGSSHFINGDWAKAQEYYKEFLSKYPLPKKDKFYKDALSMLEVCERKIKPLGK